MEPEILNKIKIDCPECGNVANITTYSEDEVVFCPFCGEPIVLLSDQDESEDFDEDEEDWEDEGGR